MGSWKRKGEGYPSQLWRMACGSRDIRDIVSACTVWFTFVFRTPTPRAVEDFIIKVLLASRGARPSASALLPSFTSLLYHKDGDLSRGFLTFSEKLFSYSVNRHFFVCALRLHLWVILWGLPLLASPLNTLIISQTFRFVKGFFNFFLKFF